MRASTKRNGEVASTPGSLATMALTSPENPSCEALATRKSALIDLLSAPVKVSVMEVENTNSALTNAVLMVRASAVADVRDGLRMAFSRAMRPGVVGAARPVRNR